MSHTVLTYSKQNLWNRNKEDLTKSTSVVPVKYPPKVKFKRISTILKCQSWENYASLDLWEFLGFYSNVELTFVSWWRKHFLVEKIVINTHVLRDHFLVEIPLLGLGIEYKIFPCIDIHGDQARSHWDRRFTWSVSLVVRRCFASRECEADELRHRPPGRCRRPIKGPLSP